jgi:hypothetical protein
LGSGKDKRSKAIQFALAQRGRIIAKRSRLIVTLRDSVGAEEAFRAALLRQINTYNDQLALLDAELRALAEEQIES